MATDVKLKTVCSALKTVYAEIAETKEYPASTVRPDLLYKIAKEK